MAAENGAPPRGPASDAALAAALAAGATQEAAGAAVGVSARTVRRRLEGAALRAEVGRMRQEIAHAVLAEAAAAAGEAVQVLVAIMRDLEAGPGARLAAARALLQTAGLYSERSEVSDRVGALEDSLKLPKG